MFKKIVFGLLLSSVVILTGCPQREESQELTEPATVAETVYTPDTHGSGVGMSSKGSLVVTSVDTEPVYAVVFQCQHGKFIINRKSIWDQVKAGDKVTVHYKEIYSTDADAKTRTLEEYDFLYITKDSY